MNPRPKTINLGFYILILNFKVSQSVSFRMDTSRYSLNNLTFRDQASLSAVLQK